MQNNQSFFGFEQKFKNIDNKLRSDSGISTEMDYIEQTSWILFLKYLEDLEQNKKMESELNGKEYKPLIDAKYTWSSWASPKTSDGKLDINRALTGQDLIDFINKKDTQNKGLFQYLSEFKYSAISQDTLEYKIGEIFGDNGIKNKIADGYILRDIINIIDEMHFQTAEEKHELSSLYETKIKNMGNSGRNGGEFYTPRPLIRSIVKQVNPKIGDRIYDGACGSAGFLVEAFNYLKESKQLSTEEMDILQKRTLYGKEYKPLPYIIATMNMILHGVESPNLLRKDTLSENIMNIQESEQYDIILANPPFGAATQPSDIQNFPIRSGESAYLFMQHFIKNLKVGGRAGIVIKNTFLSNGDAQEVRKELLQSCNVYAILDLPQKVFTVGVRTIVLFFEKGTPTKKIWYYQLNLDRTLGKTNPLNEHDLADFEKHFADFSDSENSWTINLSDVNSETLDLSVKNPNKNEEIIYRDPNQILSDLTDLESKSNTLIQQIKGEL